MVYQVSTSFKANVKYIFFKKKEKETMKIHIMCTENVKKLWFEIEKKG